MEHKHLFHLGDTVEWTKPPMNVQRGIYEVTRQLPAGTDGEPQYRIRSKLEVTERVVTERQICSRMM
jgi:hypothetical protein